jgi:hypothetical protein
MKSALVSPNEHVFDPVSQVKLGVRVCWVLEKGTEFEVGGDLHWVDCGDEVEADKYYLSDTTGNMELTPVAPRFIPTVTASTVVEDIIDGQ